MNGFQAKSAAFSAANAVWLGRAAQLAYSGAAAVKTTTAKWGMTSQFVSAKVGICDTQAFVAREQAIVVVAFRGTETDQPEDFLCDAKFDEDPVRPAGAVKGRVHKGFQEALDAAWPAVDAAIKTARDANQTLWLTGHSLGAGLATLAAARLSAAGTNVSGLYTFGSPRTGDRDFAASLVKLAGGRMFRFVNHRDIVTRVPPEKIGALTYKHVGEVKYFNADGDLSGGPTIWEEIKDALSNLDWDAITSGHPNREQLLAKIKEPLEDHAMARYMEKLSKIANV
jgi:triacylglycerol lipase